MNNFIFENKTKVYFGKGGVKEYLGSLLVNYGETVMLAYGGGSIKRNGVYDEIMGILNAAGKRVVEFDRIMSNPTYAKAQEGAKLARENHVDLILAVGGGSVSDCCKVISAQGKLDEDIWKLENTFLALSHTAARSSLISLNAVKIGVDEVPRYFPTSRAVMASVPLFCTISNAAFIISSLENFGFGGITVSPFCFNMLYNISYITSDFSIILLYINVKQICGSKRNSF